MAAREREHCFVQKKGKERDLYTCQICGSTDHVEGHHILNYQYGGAANVDNIVTLCKKCHKQVTGCVIAIAHTVEKRKDGGAGDE